MPQATTTSTWWGQNSDPAPRAPGWGVPGGILQLSECSARRRLDGRKGHRGTADPVPPSNVFGEVLTASTFPTRSVPQKEALGNGTGDEANYRFPSASHFRSQSHPPQAWETSPVLSSSAVDRLTACAPVGSWPCDSSGGWSQVMKELSAMMRIQVRTRHMSPHEAGTVVRSTVQWSCLSPGLSQDTFLYLSSSGSRHSPGVELVWAFSLLC